MNEETLESLYLRNDEYVDNTFMTFGEINSKLSGLHFAKEALSDGEREILYMAEALLRHTHEVNNTVKQALKSKQNGTI